MSGHNKVKITVPFCSSTELPEKANFAASWNVSYYLYRVIHSEHVIQTVREYYPKTNQSRLHVMLFFIPQKSWECCILSWRQFCCCTKVRLCLYLPGPIYEHGLTLIPEWLAITCPVKCGMKLLIHSQTSVVAPLKFSGEVISLTKKLKHVSKGAPELF